MFSKDVCFDSEILANISNQKAIQMENFHKQLNLV